MTCIACAALGPRRFEQCMIGNPDLAAVFSGAKRTVQLQKLEGCDERRACSVNSIVVPVQFFFVELKNKRLEHSDTCILTDLACLLGKRVSSPACSPEHGKCGMWMSLDYFGVRRNLGQIAEQAYLRGESATVANPWQ